MTYESSVDRWVRIADESLAAFHRKHCQHLDCEKLADVSVEKTSLAYCADHYLDYQLSQDLYRRIDQCREQDANTYSIEAE